MKCTNDSEDRKDKILDNIVYINLVNKMKITNEISINPHSSDKL